MLKKKNVLIILSILLLFSLFLGTWGYGQYKKIKTTYFNPLKNDNGRVNILVLGINGSGGVDQDLTDTIIFASVNKNANKITLLSVPRDLWVEDLKAKINTAYHFGGIDLTKKTVEGVLGQPIHYHAVINFDSFEKIVDFLGGVEVEVERTFDDYKYPIPGKEKDLCNGDRQLKCRYEHLRFEKGGQQMDGETALKFVRSRNAQGEEGTDFARSARQQKVLLAIKDKISRPEFYKERGKVVGLLKLVQQEVVTDVKPDVYGSLALLAYDFNKNKVNIKMTTLNGDLLVNPKYHYSKQWVLIPKSGDWEGVRKHMLGLLGI